MKNFISLFVFICLAFQIKVVYADYALLQKNNCLACHYIDKRKYGPKLNEVALRYANDTNAKEKLAKKIKSGGSGVWGEDIMPPQPHVSNGDAIALAKYILSLK